MVQIPETEKIFKKPQDINEPVVDISVRSPDNIRQIIQEQAPKITPAIVQAGGFTGDPLTGGGASQFLQPFAQEEEQEKPPIMETLKAAFRMENTAASGLALIMNGTATSESYDEDYDVIPSIKGTKYEPYLDNFMGVYSDEQRDAVMQRIDQEEQARSTIEAAGWQGFMASMVAGLVDPINLIPIGGTAYKAFKAGRMVRGAIRGVETAALSTTAQEAILQGQQETRTIEESAINIAGGALLGGLISGAAAGLSKVDFDNLSSRLERDMQREESQIQIDESGNLSAAKVENTTLDDETLSPGIGGSAKAVIKSTQKLNPMLDILNAPSLEARRLLPRLVRLNMYMKKNSRDIATDHSVEIAIKSYDKGLGNSLRNNNILLKKFSGGGLTGTIKSKSIKGSRFFNEEVGKAMRRGDQSSLPEVAASAQTFRNEVFSPMLKSAVEVKLLPEELLNAPPKTAESYLTRSYKKEKILDKREQFEDIIKTAARGRLIPDLRKKLESTEKQISAKQQKQYEIERKQAIKDIKEKTSSLAGKSDDAKAKIQADLDKLIDRRIELDILVGDDLAVETYISEIAQSVTDKILGFEKKGFTNPAFLKVIERGPAKERLLTFVEDLEIEDFLESDITKVASAYVRTMAPDIELKRSFGSLDLEPELRAIEREYSDLARNAKTLKEKQKLKKQLNKTLETFQTFIEVIRGNYGSTSNPDSIWKKGLAFSRDLQYKSKLGGVAISSIPDIARHVQVHGMFRVFGDGLFNVITNLKGVKLSIADAKEAGQLWETELQRRMLAMADLADPYATKGKFETFNSYLTTKFSSLNLMNLWNNTQKGFASLLTQQRMIRGIKNFDKLKPKEKEYLAMLGIDSKNMNLIKEQLDLFGTKEQIMNIANLEKWTNPEAVRLYRNALNTDVDRTIVTKGVGDTPLFMNRDIGKTTMQFKSFALAANQQVLIAGLQQGDMAFLNGTITMITLGMLTYYLKTKGVNKEVSDDPKVWLAEGIDRSGLLAVYMEMNGALDAFGVGTGNLLKGEPLSRYASRNFVGSMTGPSMGLLQDAAEVSTAAMSDAMNNGDFTEKDLHKIRRNLPYQNIFYLRSVFDKLEESIGENL